MIKRVVQSPVFLAVLFLVAAALILIGGIGTAQSAPRIQSRNWQGEVELTSVHTVLMENGEDVEGNDTLLGQHFFNANGFKNGESDFQVGVTYKEELAVRNDGGYDEYVRVTVTKFWAKTDDKGRILRDKDGNPIKDTNLKPEYIKLEPAETSDWVRDTSADTDERMVFYYAADNPKGKGLLEQGHTSESALTKEITIDEAVLNDPAYANRRCCIKATVDAVQDHNSVQARIGAWGTMK